MRLKGKKIAIFVAPLFEDIEFWYPYYRMQEEGADVTIIGPEKTTFTGKRGLTATADEAISDVRAIEYDLVIVPGGYSPDHMRRSPKMVDFLVEMNKQRKTIAAICHGPWMMASADVIRDRKVTSFSSIKDDLVNAGADWTDQKVVRDGNIITSRMPDDLPAFCIAMIENITQEETETAAQS